jgi:hypothetical protein
MGANRNPWPAAAALALLLWPAAALAENGLWEKNLEVNAGFCHSRNRINVQGEFFDKARTTLELRLRGEADRNGAESKWANSLNLDYASSWSKDETYEYDTPRWRENRDELTLDSVFTRKTRFFADPYGAINMMTSVHDSNSDSEFRALRPLQFRESGGLIVHILDTRQQELSVRAGLFNQHYLNTRLPHHERSYGSEGVLEYDGKLNTSVSYVMKAGIYYGFVGTDDSWDRMTESKKSVLEWDNTISVTLAKHLKLIFSFNMDNKDVGSEEIDYEWDERTTLALSWNLL